MPFYEAPSPDPSTAVLIADAATWEAAIAALGRHSRDALAIRAEVSAASNRAVVRITVSREIAATVLAWSQHNG